MRFSLFWAAILLASSPLLSHAGNENLSTAIKTQDFTLEIVKSDGSLVEMKRQHGLQVMRPDETEHYTLRVTNNTNERIMVLTSIDGLDPYNGKKAIRGGHGPVIDPGKTLELREHRVHKKAAAEELRLDPSRKIGVISIISFRERMDYPHLMPWSDHLAKRVGGEVRKGSAPGELLWLPPSGAPFRKLSDDPAATAHLEYGFSDSLSSL